MPLRLAGGLDLIAGALITGGAALLAFAIAAAVIVRAPAAASLVGPSSDQTHPNGGRRLAELPADRVATILNVDAVAGAGGAPQSGDRVDVLGYFSRQITGGDSVTRVLVDDVPELTADRAGGSVALTLAMPPDAALALQAAQAHGARPFVTLRSARTNASEMPRAFSDTDLASRLAGPP